MKNLKKFILVATILCAVNGGANPECRLMYEFDRTSQRNQTIDPDVFVSEVGRRLLNTLKDNSKSTSQALNDAEARLQMHPSFVSEINYKTVTNLFSNPSPTEKQTFDRLDVYFSRMVEMSEKIKLLSKNTEKGKKKNSDFELYREIEDLFNSTQADLSFFSQRKTFLKDLVSESEAIFSQVADLENKSAVYLYIVNKLYDQITDAAGHDVVFANKIVNLGPLVEMQRLGMSVRLQNLGKLREQLDMRLVNLKQVEDSLVYQDNASLKNQLVTYGFTLGSAQEMIQRYAESQSAIAKRKQNSFSVKYKAWKNRFLAPLSGGKKVAYSLLTAATLVTAGIGHDQIGDHQRVAEFNDQANRIAIVHADKVSAGLRYIVQKSQNIQTLEKELARPAVQKELNIDSIIYLARTLPMDQSGTDLSTMKSILVNVKPSRPFTNEESVDFREAISKRIELYDDVEGFRVGELDRSSLEKTAEKFVLAAEKGLTVGEYEKVLVTSERAENDRKEKKDGLTMKDQILAVKSGYPANTVDQVHGRDAMLIKLINENKDALSLDDILKLSKEISSQEERAVFIKSISLQK